MIEVTPGASFEAVLESGASGLVGDIGLLIIDNVGGISVAFSTADIIETPGASGVYAAVRTAPVVGGQFTIVWQLDSTGQTYGAEDLVVTGAAIPTPTPQPAGASGLCGSWASGADVLDCCGPQQSTDGSEFELLALEASEVLYQLSGRLFSGFCQGIVRPCNTSGCGFQVLSRGHIVPWSDGDRSRPTCGCSALSRVKLAGDAVSIVEVTIDGATVDAAGYRLDSGRWLTRMADPNGRSQSWPGCQRLDLPETEVGTFAVEYVYGRRPPVTGQLAAAQLACELWRACPGNDAAGECRLPRGTVRVTRENITVERKEVTAFVAAAPTGLVHVDAFMAAYGGDYVPRRRPAVWSPDVQPYAKRLG